MRLKVLGAYGASDSEHNLTGYLVDERFAIDAGTMTSKLTLAQQSRIEAIYISHAHADHIRDLPHLILNRFNQNVPPLVIVAVKAVMEQLANHVFNGQVWPDFEKLVSPSTGKPAIQYRPVAAGKKITIGDAELTVIPVDHSVAAAGVIVQLAGQSIVFSGDTGPTSEIWKRTNQCNGVVAIVTEASFPNDFGQLARDSGHLCPDSLGLELKKIEKDVPIYASHRKIPFERKIESEIKNLRDRRARVMIEKQYTLG